MSCVTAITIWLLSDILSLLFLSLFCLPPGTAPGDARLCSRLVRVANTTYGMRHSSRWYCVSLYMCCSLSLSLSLSLCTYIYIYIYVYTHIVVRVLCWVVRLPFVCLFVRSWLFACEFMSGFQFWNMCLFRSWDPRSGKHVSKLNFPNGVSQAENSSLA